MAAADGPRLTAPGAPAGSARIPEIKSGLVESLASAYATLIKRQRTASAAFVRWSSPHRRAHEFAWLEPGRETLMSTGEDVTIAPFSTIHDSMNKMMATIELNPYERELLYGYPYIVGQIDDVPIRAPLLTLPISISAAGGPLTVHREEDLIRFNSLPFRSEFETSVHEAALARLIEQTPEFPLDFNELRRFVDALDREMKTSSQTARLDGTLGPAPAQPRGAMALTLVDSAACFIAPKTSYFLSSDLLEIAKAGASSAVVTALGWLLGGHGSVATSDMFTDTRRVFFPFGSNASQRRVALLAEDPQNEIIVVQGPPGTGKSRTIANVACHLVATGKRVLITAQKDKAMEVVDAELRTLNLPQLPMTLLRQDRDSKHDLRERLDSIQKTRASSETAGEKAQEETVHGSVVRATEATESALGLAIDQEERVALADKTVREASDWIRRLRARASRWSTLRTANRLATQSTDVLGEQARMRREELLARSLRILETAAEHRTGEATRAERNQLREFSKLLGRNQTHYRNFSIFDRMKSEPQRCEMLLKILPCWIMSPDDVARLFPCSPGLFDVVIIDEASQCDLPSMTPVLYRAKQAIIAGDSKQMQAQRFAFTSAQVAAEAWRQFGLDRLDPDGWLDPARISLLELASVRGSEEAFLDEHFRSLPGIITFSNERWYGSRMRLMRDRDDRRGEPDAPIVRMHRVPDGLVTPNTQENLTEAKALVDELKRLMEHPAYAEASFGVICLFEQQIGVIQELVVESIDEELRDAHQLVVVNPDGFQGDERDVVLYTLSFDATNMEQAALSARQADRPHIQGMLNVAFTRAREEMHIFHSAPIEKFGMASGEGTIRDWLEYAVRVEQTTLDPGSLSLTLAQSEFEVEVMKALQNQGLKVLPQYPSCGFFIDLVAERDGRRVAIECDGEVFHEDVHGNLRIEDVRRQEILERAGWRVLRIPYRAWRRDPNAQITRVATALVELTELRPDPVLRANGTPTVAPPAKTVVVSTYEAAILRALRGDARDRTEVLNAARVHLGKARLGSQIRRSLEAAIVALEARKLLVSEEGELFATDEGRSASLSTYAARVSSGRKRGYYGSYRRYGHARRW